MTDTDSPTYDSILIAYDSILSDASMAETMQAATWYNEANTIAIQFSTRYHIDLNTAAGVIAAFSPRTKWAQNILNAERFLNGEAVPALGNNIKMANAVLEKGIGALNGRKTNSFAHNIAGNMDKVTIDVWMIRAAGYARKDANKSMYDLMETIIVELAEDYGIEPAQAQALIWIRIRGSHV